MNGKRILFALYVSFAVAVLTSTVFGKSGVLAMRSLEAERDRVAANMLELRRINGELEGSLLTLQSDPDALAVYARELGFASSDRERFIRIEGARPTSRRTTPAGNLLDAARPEALGDEWVRAIALLSALGALVAAGRLWNSSSGPLGSKPRLVRRRGSRS